MVSLGVAIIGAANYIITFQLKKYNPNVLLTSSGLCGLVLALFICPFDQQNKIFHDFNEANFLFLFISSCLGIFGLFLDTYSCQRLNPVVFSVLRILEVVISYVLQVIITGISPNYMTMVGTALILTSTLLVPLEPYLVSKKETKTE